MLCPLRSSWLISRSCAGSSCPLFCPTKRYGVPEGVDAGWCRINAPDSEAGAMFRDPYVVRAQSAAGFHGAATAWAGSLLDRLVDRLIARRAGSSIVSAAAPASAPQVSTPQPVDLVFELDANLERIRAVPAATRLRWGFPDGWGADLNADPSLPKTVFDVFNGAEVLHDDVRLNHSLARLTWVCPSGRVAREQARKLATVPGFAPMVFRALAADIDIGGEVGSTDFWIALRQIDAA